MSTKHKSKHLRPDIDGRSCTFWQLSQRKTLALRRLRPFAPSALSSPAAPPFPPAPARSCSASSPRISPSSPSPGCRMIGRWLVAGSDPGAAGPGEGASVARKSKSVGAGGLDPLRTRRPTSLARRLMPRLAALGLLLATMEAPAPPAFFFSRPDRGRLGLGEPAIESDGRLGRSV